MSLVETVLKRMQAEAAASRDLRVCGKVVDTAASPNATRRVISINQDALRAAGFLAPKHQEREIANQYRHIKRPLIAAAMGKRQEPLPNGRLIMVASALASEGKTFTAINLAFSMAMEEGLEIVLVDGDVAKPQISSMFGVDTERGLLDGAIDPSVDLEQLILQTDIPNLFLLPAGTRSERATELLASEQMAETAGALLRRNNRRILLFDSAPLLLTTEAGALADLVGQVVVVVRADRTEYHILAEALGRLPESCSPSLVLNQGTANSGRYYYYGEYGTTLEPSSATERRPARRGLNNPHL